MSIVWQSDKEFECFQQIVQTDGPKACMQYVVELVGNTTIDIFEKCYDNAKYDYKCIDGSRQHCYDCEKDGYNDGYIEMTCIGSILGFIAISFIIFVIMTQCSEYCKSKPYDVLGKSQIQ